MQQQGMGVQPGLLQQVGMQGHQSTQHLQQQQQQQQQQTPSLAALLAGVNGTRIGGPPLGAMPNGLPQFAMPQYNPNQGYSNGIGLGMGNQGLAGNSSAGLAAMYGGASQAGNPGVFPTNMTMMPTSNQGQFPGLQAYQKVAVPSQQVPSSPAAQQQVSQKLPQQLDQQSAQQQPGIAATAPSAGLSGLPSPMKADADDKPPGAEQPTNNESPSAPV